jgi:hypothetical protein
MDEQKNEVTLRMQIENVVLPEKVWSKLDVICQHGVSIGLPREAIISSMIRLGVMLYDGTLELSEKEANKLKEMYKITETQNTKYTV